MILISFALLVAACTSLPTLDRQLNSSRSVGMDQPTKKPSSPVSLRPPTVQDLVEGIECELEDARAIDLDHPSDAEKTIGDALSGHEYVVFATLTADILTNDGLNPSLSFISPRALATENLTKLIGGQWSGTQHKQFIQSFALNLQNPIAPDQEKTSDCPNRILKGKLGIAEVLQAGLRYAQSGGLSYPLVKDSQCRADVGQPDTTRPTFGATIDFTVVLGVNGGPTWTLTHFKGPSAGGSAGGAGAGGGVAGAAGGGAGGGGGWMNLTNTEKDILQLNFAPAIVDPLKGAPSAIASDCKKIAEIAQEIVRVTIAIQHIHTEIQKQKEALDRLRAQPHEELSTDALISMQLALDNSERMRQDLEKNLNTLKDQQAAALAVDSEPRSQAAARAAQNASTNQLLQTLVNGLH